MHVDAEMPQPGQHQPPLAQQGGGGDRAADVVGLGRLGGGERLQLLVAQHDEQDEVALRAACRPRPASARR